MLGLVVVVLGALFIALGLHAVAGGGGAAGARPRPPVAGAGSGERPPTPASRKMIGAMWITLGALFLVAAFTHQVP